MPRSRVVSSCATMTDSTPKQIIPLTMWRLEDSASEEVDHSGDVALLPHYRQANHFPQHMSNQSIHGHCGFLPESTTLPTLQIPFQQIAQPLETPYWTGQLRPINVHPSNALQVPLQASCATEATVFVPSSAPVSPNQQEYRIIDNLFQPTGESAVTQSYNTLIRVINQPVPISR